MRYYALMILVFFFIVCIMLFQYYTNSALDGFMGMGLDTINTSITQFGQ